MQTGEAEQYNILGWKKSEKKTDEEAHWIDCCRRLIVFSIRDKQINFPGAKRNVGVEL